MAIGLKVIPKEPEEDPNATPPLNPRFPWTMVPFPYGVAKVGAEPPLKSALVPVLLPVDSESPQG